MRRIAVRVLSPSGALACSLRQPKVAVLRQDAARRHPIYFESHGRSWGDGSRNDVRQVTSTIRVSGCRRLDEGGTPAMKEKREVVALRDGAHCLIVS